MGKALDDLLEEYSDSGEQNLVGQGALSEIVALANRQLELDREVKKLEIALSEKKEELRSVSQDQLPEAMLNAGVSDFTLSDGSKVTVRQDVQTSIKSDRRADALAWLEQHGHGSIIKHNVSVAFGKGDGDQAHEAFEALQKAGFQPTDKLDVHHQTLQAWGRKQAQEGERPPDDLFNVFSLQISKIQGPKT